MNLRLEAPRVGDVGLLAIVPDRWEGMWTTRHHVLGRLSEYFHVVWVDPGYRLRPQDWRRRWLQRSARVKWPNPSCTWPGVTVLEAGPLHPLVGRPDWVGRILDGPRLRRAVGVLKNRGCRKVILHIWRPYFARALDLVDYDVSCYHIDDEYSFSDVDLPVANSEVEFICRVDQVFVTSEGLLEKKGKLNPAARYVPNGVDFQAHARPAAEPLDLQEIPHPRIGYSGVIKWTLDWALLSQLTLQHPDWQFILVGPTQPHPAVVRAVRDLSTRSNVHLLGAKPPDEILAYPQHFDVCIMPYRLDSHMLKYGYPLKLHEYLATGRPTVGTPLHSLVAVTDVVRLARTPEEWSQALTDCLAPEAMDPRQVEARRTVARQHDWDALVEIIADTLCERLGPYYLAQLRSSSVTEQALGNRFDLTANDRYPRRPNT